jgi:uncharacterized protein with ParB-like and HNH nuclease domain/predicted transport protein
MQAKEANFLKFLQSNNNQFIIPIYQRTYSWNIPQCQQLWNDIIRVAENPNIPGHFIGSIVYIAKGIYSLATTTQLLVIDGQQRLTTLTLLLAAMAKAIEQSTQPYEITNRKIRNLYLLNPEESGEQRYKLILTQNDRDTLKCIVDEDAPPIDTSIRVIENYQFFERQIRESKIDLGVLFTGIGKLIIVDVSLDRTQDNPQLIFESLNSTGLELSQADLIRNFILMGLEPKEQEYLYNHYWYLMEQSFGHPEYSSHFDRFMRDYLTVKNEGRIPNIDRVYMEFKIYVRSHPKLTMRDIVADIYKYSKYFVQLAFEKDVDQEIGSGIRDINILKVDVAYPFLLEVFDWYAQDLLKQEDVVTILKIVESYIFRRVICGIPTNSLNKTFATLPREIDKDHYVEGFQAIMLLKDSYRRFPNDEEFRQQFVFKDVYNFRSRNYLLRKLENYGRKELVNVESYTIEHILPQNPNLSPQWRTELGLNWQQIQTRYMHTIGNLTLTGYNSEYSDHSFKEKRDYPENKGFRNSPLNLNQGLANLDHWNEETIKSRAAKLAELAVKLWPYPALPNTSLNKYRPSPDETAGDDGGEYPLEHYEYLQSKMLNVFIAFRQRVLNIDASVREEHKKKYIAFKTTTNFVDVVPQSSRLRLSLNMPYMEIVDPKGLCKDITGLGRWGNGDVEVGISSLDELNDVMDLVEQAFMWVIDN